MKKFYLLLTLISSLTSISNAQVTVLTYHSISDKHNDMATSVNTFDKQMDYLISKKVSFISSTELINSILQKKELPDNSVVLTFDDGWKSQVLAMDVLEKNHIPATFAIVTQFQKINSPTCLQKEDFIYFEKLKANFIYVNHSYTHDLRDYLKNPEEDLLKSETELKKLQALNINIEPYYIYPYGKKNSLLLESLKEHHYIAAFGVGGRKFSTKNVDIYNIPRFLVNEHTDLTKLF